MGGGDGVGVTHDRCARQNRPGARLTGLSGLAYAGKTATIVVNLARASFRVHPLCGGRPEDQA